ncbi:MAG TPA: cupin domain-containing protein [archaeon]|nr:cupin domain-containing protein [archaeon]
MKIIDVKDVEAKEIVGDPLFFGKVYTKFVFEEEHKAKKIQVIMVSFAPGARNKLHTHSTEQILIVTEGRGIVANKNQENIVTPGMIIFVPPGEEHWHGATKDSSFVHISIVGQPQNLRIVEK